MNLNLKTLLVLSLVVNLGLAVAYFRKGNAASPRMTDTETTFDPANGETSGAGRQPLFTRAQAAFNWQHVESADYLQYIENLRSIGCPEETIRDIIMADVNKMFDSRKQERTKTNQTFEFWKTGSGLFVPPDPAKQQEEMTWRSGLAQEKRALLKDLLGVDIPVKPESVFSQSNPMELMLGFLPSGKRDLLMELEQKYAALRAAPGSVAAPGDLTQAKKLQADKEAELGRILSPQELEEYQLRMSPVAMNMRAQLSGFEPTEQEFRELFRLRKKFEDEHGGMSTFAASDPVSVEKRLAAQQQTEVEIRRVVGEDRYAEYERNQDWAYKSALQIAQQEGLSKEAAVRIYELKKLAEEQAREFRTDQTLSVAEQLQAMAAIRAETERAIIQTLGQPGFESYQKQIGGSWLRTLSPGPGRVSPAGGF